MQHDEPTSTSTPTSSPAPPPTMPPPAETTPAEASASAAPAPETSAPAPAPAPDDRPRPGRVWGAAMLAGLVAAVLSAAVGELTYETFQPDLMAETVMGVTSMVPSPAGIARSTRQNAALTFGLSGGLFGLAMGLAGGQASRRGPMAAWPGAVGLVLGVVIAGLAAWLLVPAYFRYEAQVQNNLGEESLLIPLLVKAGLWGAIGAAGGLAFGLGLGGRTAAGNLAVRSLVGGLAGAALAGAVYVVLGGALFPMSNTVQPFADEFLARVLIVLLAYLLASAATAFAVLDAQRPPRPSN